MAQEPITLTMARQIMQPASVRQPAQPSRAEKSRAQQSRLQQSPQPCRGWQFPQSSRVQQFPQRVRAEQFPPPDLFAAAALGDAGTFLTAAAAAANSATAGIQERERAKISRMEREQPDTYIHSRGQLPSIPAGQYEVWYAEQAIEDLGVVGRMLQFYHSGLVFRPVNHGGARRAGEGIFTLQYYATDFPYGAIFPKGVGDDGLPIWNNSAVIAYTNGYDTERWTMGEQLVGEASAEVLMKFFDWILDDFIPKHPGYQIFDVWDRAVLHPQTQVFWEGSMCDRFTHEGLRQLYTLGANMTIKQGRGRSRGRIWLRDVSNAPVYRNYVPLLSDSRPETVDLGDPAQVEQVNAFFGLMCNLVQKGLSEKSFEEFVQARGDQSEFWYVYDSVNKNYLRVSLVKPYLSQQNLYQEMDVECPYRPD
eukprot:gnl/TRDRNA2_/TRDRNA2_58128_c0_seq1.p1 gnl/TRDRNA2_/TRDRNA2_58128_c0~~gnl/TRDRNA2_/TRDRNA2_58128_c0_seq1.p1  ORF type:complete len:446 (+),score=55.18 gnl/TRDRNA2_/TRDRNA2_58128_c0_seq1:77-1339(+)